MSLFTGLKEFEEFEQIYQKLQVPQRIRYIVPTYEKFYTIWQYDRLKFRVLMNEWLRTDEGKYRTLETLRAKQKEVLDQCYILDEYGNKKRDCDEKHIFRYGTLERIHEAIYNEIMFKRIEGKRYVGDEITLNDEEMQAELKDTWQLSIRDRIKVHIKLLRRLRENNAVE